MGRKALRLRDLRSLDRRSMYSIFAPLDPNERLPREMLLEARRYRWLQRSTLVWAGALLYLPALMLAVVLLSWMGVGGMVTFAVAALMLAGFYVYALKAKY
jgi:hypothetical protein